MDVHNQSVTVRVSKENTDYDMVLTAVYAHTDYIFRRELWEHLSDLKVRITDPWAIGGDYNAIMCKSEKLGGAAPNIRAMNDFTHFQHDNDLIDLGFEGSMYTWSNNNPNNPIWERLDRIMVNHEFVKKFPETYIAHQTQLLSDHSPIIICSKEHTKMASSFKFLSMWTTHSDCESIIAETWAVEVISSPLYKLQIKLKMLKEKLKIWNKNIFENIFDKIKEAEQGIRHLEEKL